MNKLLILLLLQFILYSCNNQQEKKTTQQATTQDTLTSLQETVLATLPDSLQPKIVLLANIPAPKVIQATKVEIKPLAVLQNEKGKPILDSEGKPYIMGDDGKSNFTNFSTDNGLALDVINCSVEDKTGNLWFGTAGGGVSRYDGKTFTSYTTAQGLAHNNIRSIIEDKMGNLWFGTGNGGVSRYDGKTFMSYTSAQGLANNGVLSIIEDKTGNLWFGTKGGGVSRYDGNRVEAIQRGEKAPLSDQQDLKKDKNGNLVKTFTSYTTAQGLANNDVLSILEDKTGNLWFGTAGGGASRYDGKTFTNYTTAQGLANNNVRSIFEDKTGNLWFGTQGGASRYDGKTFTNYTTAQGLANNNVRSIFEDKTGNLWFGTQGGVSRYEDNTFTSYTAAQGLANNDVLCIIEDKTGNLWLGTFGGGVSRYDGKTFTNYTTAQGLANNFVYSILEDKTGNLWFGTGGGVSRYDGNRVKAIQRGMKVPLSDQQDLKKDKNGLLVKTFTSYTFAQGLANNFVYSILEDKTGNLWFGTGGGGVSRYDGKTFTSYTTAQGLAHNQVFSILEDKTGNLWFGTRGGGVSRYDGKTFTSFTTAQGLANNFVTSILEDKTGNLWFGTNGDGVSRYDGNRVEAIQRGEKVPLSDQQDLKKDKNGNLVKTFTSYTTAQGLSHNQVFSILEDKTGNLWFGTSEGLSLLGGLVGNGNETDNSKPDPDSYRDPKKGKAGISSTLFKSFKIKDGLPDNHVTNVIQMPNGKIAVGTNLGITLLNLSKDGTKLIDIEIYNTNTGYPVKDVNVGQNCMLLDSKGVIWAGTGSEKTALVRFDYAALHKNTEPPMLVIQSVKVKDENICWYNLQTKGIRKNSEDSSTAILQEFFAYGKTLSSSENDSILKRFGSIKFDGITPFYPLPENLVLPYKHNQIAFEFAAIETDRPFLVKYQYMLEGYDKDWSPVTNKSNANFGNISEGTYTFKLKAQGANGVWCKPIIYTFKVLPPWYRTWWAYLIYALLFLGALRIFSNWRERKLRAEKERLEKIVEERTEELIQKNIVIENEKTEADRQRDEADKQRDEANKQRQLSDDLLLNILPEEVAEELKSKGSAEAKQFDEVTVLFADFKNFTQISEKMTPKELVEEIHTCFKAFDQIIEKHGIEKIKTIGDSYMCAGGLPVTNATHALDVVSAGLEMLQFILNRMAERVADGMEPFQIRIGIHTGPVVAGIVGIKKFAYDIWGDTVNIASRMESSGEAGKVNISGATFELVKNKFICSHRGKIQAKNKGELDMFFVEGRI